MTKAELEARIARLENDLADVIAGGRGIYPLIEYAKGEGTGYRAYAKAKETIEALILKAKVELADLPQPSKFEQIKDQCEMEYGGEIPYMDALDAYIKALEACRPWVIKNRHNGGILCSGEAPYGLMMFPTREKAVDFCDASRCDVVQWEGNK